MGAKPRKKGSRRRPGELENGSRSDHVSEQVRRLLAQGSDRPAVLQGFLDGLSKGDERALRELLERTTRTPKQPPASPGT